MAVISRNAALEASSDVRCNSRGAAPDALIYLILPGANATRFRGSSLLFGESR